MSEPSAPLTPGAAPAGSTTSPTAGDAPGRSESAVVLLIAAVQFVNVLEFMMVAPLGPDFASALAIPSSHLGWLVAAYTGAAAVAGLIGGLFLDRYDRRVVLAGSMLGLVVGTVAAGFATSFEGLLTARVLAGFFGGPATAVSLSIVADVVPIARRGQAIGRVMSGFALASVAGVPLVLEIAHRGGWTMPFFFVGALTLVIGAGVIALLPPLTSHIDRDAKSVGYGDLLVDPTVRLSYVLAALLMTSSFMVIPNIATFLQYNLLEPRDSLGGLYLLGGTASFLGLRWLGRLVDRLGPVRLAAVGCGGQIVATVGWLVLPAAAWPLGAVGPALTFVPSYLYFPLFMFSTSCRNVALNTLTSRVPRPHERARFQSLQSATNHASAAFAGVLSSMILTETSDQALVGMPVLGGISVVLLLSLPVVAWLLEQRVSSREVARA